MVDVTYLQQAEVEAGQVALLGAALAAITFTNSDTEADANIEVVIGRTGLAAT